MLHLTAKIQCQHKHVYASFIHQSISGLWLGYKNSYITAGIKYLVIDTCPQLHLRLVAITEIFYTCCDIAITYRYHCTKYIEIHTHSHTDQVIITGIRNGMAEMERIGTTKPLVCAKTRMEGGGSRSAQGPLIFQCARPCKRLRYSNRAVSYSTE